MSFQNLRESEAPDGFAIVSVERVSSGVIIIAPHGGKIEPHTSTIAQSIADDMFSYYSFEGRKSNNNSDLHITSHRFDEPTGVALVAKHRWVVAIHGCVGDIPMVLLGGLDKALAADIATQLRVDGIPVEARGHEFPGQEPKNICNRGAASAGVQVELTMPFRTSDAVSKLVRSIRAVLMQRCNAV